MTTLYHNPRCSKSRATLALLRANGVQPDIVNYLETPPDVAGLERLVGLLGGSIRDIIRSGEVEYRQLDLARAALSDAELTAIVAANPRLLERPIVVHNGAAALGRPPENVLAIL